VEIYAGDIVKVTPLASIPSQSLEDDGTCSVLEVLDDSENQEIVVIDKYGDDWLLEEGEYVLYKKVNQKHEKLGFVLQTVKEYIYIELEQVELDSKEVNTSIGDAKLLMGLIEQVLEEVKFKRGMGSLVKELNKTHENMKDYIKFKEKYEDINISDIQYETEDLCKRYNIVLTGLW